MEKQLYKNDSTMTRNEADSRNARRSSESSLKIYQQPHWTESANTNLRARSIHHSQSIVESDSIRTRQVNQQLQSLPKDERQKLYFEARLRELKQVQEERNTRPLIGLESTENNSYYNFKDLDELNFLYQLGYDRKGNAIIFIVAANLPARGMDNRRIISYFMTYMEKLTCEPYVIIFAVSSSLTDQIAMNEISSESNLVQLIFDLFYYRYRDNLQQLYILHASLVFRMYIYLYLPFVTNVFWKDYIPVESLNDLERYVDIQSLEGLPEKEVSYDRATFGSNY